LSYKATQDTLKAVGIMPSPVQSQFITNIQENNLILSPVIQELLKAHNKTMMFDLQELEGEKDKEGHCS
jgi:hypothetical protein